MSIKNYFPRPLKKHLTGHGFYGKVVAGNGEKQMNKYERSIIFFALSVLISATTSSIWGGITAVILIIYGIWTHFR
jgi:hypothetical protein